MTYTIKELLTPVNHTTGRRAQIDTVVIHVTEGTFASARAWFRDPESKVSSTYGISRRGEIERWVREEDTAWANGRVYNATAAVVRERPGVNPNDYTISIEHEGDGTSDLTPEQRGASIWLLRDIARRRPQITLDRRHVIRHNEIYARKTCPGAINVDQLVRMAADASTPHAPQNEPGDPPRVVWSDFLHEWLVVARYVSDTEWYFVTATQLRNGTASRATARLSEMPLRPDT